MSKKNEAGGIILPDFKIHYKSVVTQTAWCCHKNRHTEQCNRIAGPEKIPCIYGPLIFHLFSLILDIGKTGYPHTEEWNWTLISHHIERSAKNELKIGHNTWMCETARRIHRGKAPWYRPGQWFLGYDPKSTGNKNKYEPMGLH